MPEKRGVGGAAGFRAGQRTADEDRGDEREVPFHSIQSS